jgi:hypothetical protein
MCCFCGKTTKHSIYFEWVPPKPLKLKISFIGSIFLAFKAMPLGHVIHPVKSLITFDTWHGINLHES